MGFMSDNPYLNEYVWADVRDRVHALNPEFAKIVDEIGPDDKHKLFLAKYKYGDIGIENSDFYVLNKFGTPTPLESKDVPQKMQEALLYNTRSNPIAIVMKNSFELYIEEGERVIPFALFKPGQIFGLWKLLDGDLTFAPRNFPWFLTAGARSIFMIPKISDQRNHQRLKIEYGLTLDKPQKLTDHFYVFKEISNRNNKDPWQAELLLFSKEWFSHQEDKTWMGFNFYFLKKSWQGSSYWRNQSLWNIIFSLIHKKKSLKPSLYTADIVKHILGIAAGIIPGLQAATDDSYAPIKKIVTAYEKTYELEYKAVIIQPGYFNLAGDTNYTYYSMIFQTAFELHLKSNNKNTALSDVYDVAVLLKKYLQEISIICQTFDSNIPYYKIATAVDFIAFHSNPASSQEIKHGNEIVLADKNLKYSIDNYPENASFFNGSICIKRK